MFLTHPIFQIHAGELQIATSLTIPLYLGNLAP